MKQFIKAAKKTVKVLWNIMINFQKIIMIVCSILIIIGISSQAAMRYLFKINFYGLDELIIIIAFWLYFMGSSYGSYEESHIKADIVSVYIKNKKLKEVFSLVASIITTAITLLFTYWALDLFIWGIVRQAKSPVLSIPMVIPQSAIFIGFVIMSIYSVVYLFRDIGKFYCSFIVKDNKQTGLGG